VRAREREEGEKERVQCMYVCISTSTVWRGLYIYTSSREAW